MDGVLVDSEVVVIRHEQQALRKIGIDLSIEGLVSRYVGLSNRDMAASILEEFGPVLPDGLLTQIQADAVATFPDELEPVAGMVEFAASVEGPKCVASSSTLDRITFSLELTGHHQHFDPAHLFSAQMVTNGKPAPDLFLHAAEQMGVDPADCTVIEDSPFGVQAGVAANMRVIGLVAGGHCPPTQPDLLRAAGAHAIAHSAEELANLVG